MTFLPSFCHCGTYIQSWPLKGCEKMAVGRPASTSLSNGSPLPKLRWTISRASASFSLAATSVAAGIVLGISSPPTNSTSPSRSATPARYFWNFATSAGASNVGVGQAPPVPT